MPAIKFFLKKILIIVCYAVTLITGFVGCGQSPATFLSISQTSLEVDLGNNSVNYNGYHQSPMTLALSCNGKNYPMQSLKSDDSLTLVPGSYCNLSLVSFQLMSSQESFVASTQSAFLTTSPTSGVATIIGSYVGSMGTTVNVSPILIEGSLNSIGVGGKVAFIVTNTSGVNSSLSGYSYLGVVRSSTGTMSVNFKATSGQASNLRLTTSALPTGWLAQSNSCSIVDTSNSCTLTLSYSPTTSGSLSTLTVPYTYVSSTGEAAAGTFSFSYQGLERLKWQIDMGATAYYPAVLSPDGLTLYVSNSGNSKLYAIDTTTGTQKWVTSPNYGGAPFLSANGLTLFMFYGIKVLSINVNTQVVNFDTNTTATSTFFPNGTLNKNGSIMLDGSYNGIFTARNTSTGGFIWSMSAGAVLAGSPIVDPAGSYVYFGDVTGKVYSYDVANGTQRWIYNAGVGIGTPAVSPDSGTVYFGRGSATSTITAINTNPLSLKANSATTYNTISGRLILNTAGDTLYFNDSAGNVYAMDTSSMTQKWVSASAAGVCGGHSPVLSPDEKTIYIGTEGLAGTTGSIYAFNTADGSTKWYYNMAAAISPNYVLTYPAVSPDGFTIYPIIFDRYIYAFNESVIKR